MGHPPPPAYLPAASGQAMQRARLAEVLAKSHEAERRKWSYKRKMLFGSFVVILFTAIASAMFIISETQGILGEFRAGEKGDVVRAAEGQLNVAPVEETPGLTKTTTYLLIGSDSRAPGEKYGRSDTIQLLRVYPAEGRVSLLSLPRDLLVPIPGYGEDKINAAYSLGGVPLLIQTVREYLGVPINHFFQVDFHGFIKTAKDIRPLYISIDQRYFNESGDYTPIDLRPGYQELTPEEALTFVRFRHTDSDFYRAARQQIFLRDAGRSVKEKTSDLVALRALVHEVAKQTTSDFHDLGEAVALAGTLKNISPDQIQRLSLETTPETIDGISYLVASPEQRIASLEAWDHPLTKVHKQADPQKAIKKGLKLGLVKAARTFEGKADRKDAKEAVQARRGLAFDDGGQAQVLLSEQPLPHCTPTALPAGYDWPTDPDWAVHSYEVGGEDALAIYATRASGNSILFNWLGWQTPPLLENPDETVQSKDRTYQLYRDAGHLHTIAWKERGIWQTVQNTLLNEVTDDELLATADACR